MNKICECNNLKAPYVQSSVPISSLVVDVYTVKECERIGRNLTLCYKGSRPGCSSIFCVFFCGIRMS